ncbi:hypothetical protein GCM10007164_26040 [Luteimonas padinae]|uniref:Prepilin-type N-terminal cleavage/methylation domain-containing protein n=1 Tax=Luteimonas padinae TaxID=1714359 RepID=A0ABV6SUA6_9GAMM|nr:prepilin-type N-terminal cleavage/methylation domain-containing protein [Luteimonas padinae]GHD74844.1 hypothetical protein GCM10007164_26040 [Luteimonas padinae]
MSNYRAGPRRDGRGFTLIELMIALLLGTILAGAAISVFLSSRQVYASTESLGRVQENARAAFELMSRDIRESGGNACNSSLRPVNVLNNSSLYPYADFGGGLIGYSSSQDGIKFGSGARDRVSASIIGTGNYSEAIVLKSATEGGMRVDAGNSSDVNINTFDPVPADWNNAIVMVCDPEHAAIFQATDVSGKGIKIQKKASVTPGNATNCLAPGGNCPNGSDKRYAFGCTQGWWKGGTTLPNAPKGCMYEGSPPAIIARMRSISWYVGNGTTSGKSLYRRVDGPSATADEIAENVRSLAFEYLLDGSYLSASAITTDEEWARVAAVRIKLTFESDDKSAAINGVLLGRELSTTVALRNRLQ